MADKKTKRYQQNPFVADMLIPLKNKNVRIFAAGGKDNLQVVNVDTGERRATHVVATRKVDSERFVKTFADYMAFTFDLTKAGNKVLRVVMWAMQEQAMGKDVVMLDKVTYQAFLDNHGFSPDEQSAVPSLSFSTFGRGLAELEKSKIIAKTMRPGVYYINPCCMFNGDRIAFTTVLERRSSEDQQSFDFDRNTGEVLDHNPD